MGQSRFYDPETCRFLNADTVEYLDPESINGLNLYAYCGNNPIMYSDPNGHFVLSIFLVSVLVSTILGAATGGISAMDSGEAFWKGALIGALSGAVLGAAFGLGAGLAAAPFFGQAAVSLTTGLLAFAGTAVVSFGSGIGIYAMETKFYNQEFSWNDAILSGTSFAIRASINFGMGFLLGVQGFYSTSPKIILGKGTKLFLNSVGNKIQNMLPLLVQRTYLKNLFATPFTFIVKHYLEYLKEND